MDTPTPMHGEQKTHPIMRHVLANVIVVLIILLIPLWVLWQTVPVITAANFVMPQGVLLTDSTGKELYRFHREDDRIDLPLEAFPKTLRDAVIEIEDERFYERSCIDIRALARAGFANILDYKSQGASTITQQLLRNTFDLKEKTISRKVLELSLACKMESVTTKDDILSLYLNHVSFGGSVFGAQKASIMYFGKDVRDLNLPESAILAALLQRPSYFSPYGEHKRTTVDGGIIRKIKQGKIKGAGAIPSEMITVGLLGNHFTSPHGKGVFVPGRAEEVLGAMLENGSIQEEHFLAAAKVLQTFAFTDTSYAVTTPYFPALVEREVSAIPDVGADCKLQSSGCTITSTLDPELQEIAERIVSEHADTIKEKYDANNIAMIAVDRNTRGIVAYIGNVDFNAEQNGARIDMAQAPRQPGSSFKPFVYATAFEQGYTPRSFVLDGPIVVGGNTPQNYEGGFHGWTSIRHALSASRNIPAIQTFFMVGGEEPVLNEAAKMGITYPSTVRDERKKTDSYFEFGYPLAIGAAEVPLMQMVTGYTTLANNGAYQPLTTISTVRDAKNTIVYSFKDRTQPVQVTDPLIPRQLTSILSDNYFRPTEYWRKLLTLDGIDSAVKTGTSNQCSAVKPKSGGCAATLPTDVWTIGYTPEYVVGVWVGNATHKPLQPTADGLNVASPLWKEFLESAHALHPELVTQFPADSTFDKKATVGFYSPL